MGCRQRAALSRQNRLAVLAVSAVLLFAVGASTSSAVSDPQTQVVKNALAQEGGRAADCTGAACGGSAAVKVRRLLQRPTRRPTRKPTKKTTVKPTRKPTRKPTSKPTKKPTARPTKRPTSAPTKSVAATPAPTKQPTKSPTRAPTAAPTKAPTASPTKAPTAAPKKAPTKAPTAGSTIAPTKAPTSAPTRAPTKAPTKAPTAVPTKAPTASVTGTAIAADHNDRRRLHVSTPDLAWNATIAAGAQTYAAKCLGLVHSGTPGLGENIYYAFSTSEAGIATPEVHYQHAVAAWYNEIFNYDFSTGKAKATTPNAVIGHFTQVVWKSSTQVGCGTSRCDVPGDEFPYRQLVVCNYAPPGNYIGQNLQQVMPLIASSS